MKLFDEELATKINDTCSLKYALLTPEIISLLTSIIKHGKVPMFTAPTLLEALSGISFPEQSFLEIEYGNTDFDERMFLLQTWASDTEARKIQLLCAEHILSYVINQRTAVLPCMSTFCLNQSERNKKFFTRMFWRDVYDNTTLHHSHKTMLLACVCAFARKQTSAFLPTNCVQPNSSRRKKHPGVNDPLFLQLYQLLNSYHRQFKETKFIEIKETRYHYGKSEITKAKLLDGFIDWLKLVKPDLDISILTVVSRKSHRVKQFLLMLLWRILLDKDTEDNEEESFYIIDKNLIEEGDSPNKKLKY
jgi:hypothetical protein